MPRIDKPCNYLLNTDHVHFEACFLMLDGAPREQWDYSIYLRRILYPLLAYPLMKAAGFLVGGVITSAIIQLAAFVAFIVYVRRRVGERAAYAAMGLLATYPGIYYWAGLPYCHAMIVPVCLLGMMILCELERDGVTTRRAAVLTLLMGVLFLAYDLLPIFGPAALIVLVLRKRFAAAAVALPMLVLPTIVNHLTLDALFDLPFRNKNTQTYFDILQAWMHPLSNPSHWGHLLKGVPRDLVRNYFGSNFLFLPWLFLILLVLNRFTTRIRLTLAEKALLGMTALLFAFINLAPPTPGWQFRGSGIPRIYQPMFAAMVMFAVRMAARAPAPHPDPLPKGKGVEPRWWLTGLIGAAALLNAAVVLGPVLHLKLADEVYFAFYRHARRPMLTTHLDTFGRRPLGFCDESITIENAPPKKKGPKKPPKKKKRPATTTLPATRSAVTALIEGQEHYHEQAVFAEFAIFDLQFAICNRRLVSPPQGDAGVAPTKAPPASVARSSGAAPFHDG
jgi:hypothetical protein